MILGGGGKKAQQSLRVYKEGHSFTAQHPLGDRSPDSLQPQVARREGAAGLSAHRRKLTRSRNVTQDQVSPPRRTVDAALRITVRRRLLLKIARRQPNRPIP